MPQILRIGPYIIFFWVNENEPIEPVHVHITHGRPTANATKIWLTRTGKCYLCHNRSKIPDQILRRLMRVIEARSQEIKAQWLAYFGEISYFC